MTATRIQPTKTMKAKLPALASLLLLPHTEAFFPPFISPHNPSLRTPIIERHITQNIALPQPNIPHHPPLHSTKNHPDASSSSSPSQPINNPLTSAGQSFISASSKSLGMLFYNIGGMDHKEIQAHLLRAGSCLLSAGQSWESNWTDVTYAMEDASQAFYDISNVFGSANIDESLELAMSFESIGDELRDISSISGCSAVGPPSSCGNLFAIEKHLMDVSVILKKNSVAATDEHMMCTLFKEVAELFRDMGGRYVDEVGQESEVSV